MVKPPQDTDIEYNKLPHEKPSPRSAEHDAEECEGKMMGGTACVVMFLILAFVFIGFPVMSAVCGSEFGETTCNVTQCTAHAIINGNKLTKYHHSVCGLNETRCYVLTNSRLAPDSIELSGVDIAFDTCDAYTIVSIIVWGLAVGGFLIFLAIKGLQACARTTRCQRLGDLC